jgi:hypothetical protein
MLVVTVPLEGLLLTEARRTYPGKAATEKYAFGSTGGNSNAYNKGNDSDSEKPDMDSRTTKKVELNAANLAKL